MNFFSQPRKLLAALAIAGLSGFAQADALRIETHDNFFDLVESPAYEGPAAQWSVVNITAGDSFLAYCLELIQAIDQGNQQTYARSSYAPSADVQELYDRFYASATGNADSAVGFQLALWELLGQATVADFTTSVPGSKTAALAMLDTVNNSDTGYQPGQYKFYRWNSPDHQDILQVVPADNTVPEPATLVLGGVGLMAMGLVSRRRKGRQATA